MKKLLIAPLLITFSLVLGLVLAGPVHADSLFSGSTGAACNGVQQSDSGTCDSTTTGKTINSKLTVAINLISLAVGVAAVIMVIVGGLKYIISGGDAGKVNSAKDTILYAIVGLVVVFLAQIIVRFVINKATTTVTPTKSSSKKSSLVRTV